MSLWDTRMRPHIWHKIAWKERTLRLLGCFHLIFDLKSLPGMDDIDDDTRPCSFQIFEEDTRVASISIWGVDALRREVIKLFKVCIHYDLLLVRILERLRPLNRVLALGAYGCAATQTRNITAHNYITVNDLSYETLRTHAYCSLILFPLCRPRCDQ
jgi:hypothetical protein